MVQKLTKRDIDGFAYEGSGNAAWDIRWDTLIPGFGVRVYPSGKKSYIVRYAHKNRKRLHTVGQTSKVPLDEARDLAVKHLAKIADNIDPAEEKRRIRGVETVSKAFDKFLERHAKPNNKRWPETKRIFDNDVLPHIGNRGVPEVTKQDIIGILDKIYDRGAAIMANRTLAHIKKFFRWCVGRDLIQFSPADSIAKPAQALSRDRVLTVDEMRDVWQACESIGYPYGVMIQLALVTAQRRNEVSTLKWNDIDFKNSVWHLPRENTKTDKANDIPLSALALKILKKAPRQDSELVFTTTGKTPYSGFTQGKNHLDKKIQKIRDKKKKEALENGEKIKTRRDLEPLPAWRVHDLRRTAASHMASLGIAPHVIEKILNHADGIISGVAAVYNRYEYAEEKKAALLKWSEFLKEGICPPTQQLQENQLPIKIRELRRGH
jgi:integrase